MVVWSLSYQQAPQKLLFFVYKELQTKDVWFCRQEG